jgi:integrase
MPNVRVHKPNGMLFFDFRWNGRRFREYTALPDTPENRKKLEAVLNKIEAAIANGSFDYAAYFPNSKAAAKLAGSDAAYAAQARVPDAQTEQGPQFKSFALQWVEEHRIEWRRSHIQSLMSTLNGRILPVFGEKVVSTITKSDILEFRAQLGQEKGRGSKEGLSPKRINEIMGLLRQILSETAERFGFTSPAINIKKLKQPKSDVDPFSLVDVQRIIHTSRQDFKDYFVVRFFTGMRTGEVHGLKWKYVDFDLRLIRIRETFVMGEDDYTKTEGSQRDIQMSTPVWEALQSQFKATGGKSEYVFCNLKSQPLDNKNFSDRVWYPLLEDLELKRRRPYQMRHTAATLWLASGEAPEWIARQLGHTSTEMLFRVYSRYVPNLTRQDGSAMERLLAQQIGKLHATEPIPLHARQMRGANHNAPAAAIAVDISEPVATRETNPAQRRHQPANAQGPP